MNDSGSQTSQTTGPPQWLQDYGRNYLDTASQVSNLPWENYQGPRVAAPTPTQNMAIGNLGSLAQGTDYTDAAGGMLAQTLNGGGMNPYSSQVIQPTIDAATRAYNQNVGSNMDRFNTAGNWGGSAQMQSMGQINGDYERNLLGGIAPILQSGYENERNRQMQAVPAAMGLFGGMGQANQNAIQGSDIERQYQNQLYGSQYDDWQNYFNYPNQQLGVFGNALRSMSGAAPQTTTTQGPAPDRISQGLGLWMLGRGGLFG